MSQSNAFSRDEGEGIFADERLREIAFSADVKDAGNNSEVIELSGKRFAVVRVSEVREPQVAPFSEVETEVRAALEAELEAASLIEIRGNAESMLGAGESLEVVAQSLGLEWRVELAATRLSSQLPRPVLEAAFAMPDGQARKLQTVPVPGEGYAMVQLARISPGDAQSLSGAETEQLEGLRTGEQRQLSFDEFLLHQRDVADIVIR